MIERIIEIAETAAFLSLENGLLKIRLPDGKSTTVPVSEIQCLILSNPALSVSGALLSALAEKGAAVVVCGSNRLPTAMQLPLNGNYIQNEKFRAQTTATVPLCKRLWQTVIKEKIRQQGKLLLELHKNDFGLMALAEKVNSGDTENMEGRAAVIYWKNLFNAPFQRNRSFPDNNLLLNYGYAILRAMTARACCAAGLHPTIGINHHNRYDPYCLADDLMEPFRPVIDKAVYQLNPENAPVGELSSILRKKLLEALLEKQETDRGKWQIADLLKLSVSQVANSLVSGEMSLKYY